MRSIAGHSGSPVFVYDLPYSWPGTRKQEHKFLFALLGLNIGHIVDYEPLVSLAAGKRIEHGKWVAQTNVAISHVCPAWKISELLHRPELRKQRLELEPYVKTMTRSIKAAAVKDDVTPSTSQTSEPGSSNHVAQRIEE